jgi:hypothetical protein
MNVGNDVSLLHRVIKPFLALTSAGAPTLVTAETFWKGSCFNKHTL